MSDVKRDALLEAADDLRSRRLRSFVGSDIEKGLHYAEACIRAALAHPDLPALKDDPVAVRLGIASTGWDETPPPSWQEIAEGLNRRLIEAARQARVDVETARRDGFAEAIAMLRYEPDPAPWQQKPRPTSYMRRACADYLEAHAGELRNQWWANESRPCRLCAQVMGQAAAADV